MASAKYTEDYIEKCFYAWYENSKQLSISKLPENGENGKPSRITVDRWIVSYGWAERAEILDVESTNALDQVAIEKRKKMFEEAVIVADELIEEGRKFLREKGITSDAGAIRAIDLGLATKLRSVGAAESYIKISKMSDDQLTEQLQKLIGKKEEDVDAEIIEEES